MTKRLPPIRTLKRPMLEDWDAKPLRPKYPVLCIYERISRVSGSTVTQGDGVMIHVEADDEIMDEFEKQMLYRFEKWRPSHVGARPLEWTLIKWIKPDGSQHYPPPQMKRVEPF